MQLVRSRDDHFGSADMNDGFLRLIVIDQGFEKEFFELADRLTDRVGIFFDIGANHGLLRFGLAGRHSGMIDFHLSEPNPKLVRSIELTRPLYPGMRLTLSTAAVSDHEGMVSFDINESHNGASHISSNGTGVEVPSIRLTATSKRLTGCFCRAGDIPPRGGATHTFALVVPGHGAPLLPIAGRSIPATTDLLAVPKENLAAVGHR